MVWRDNIKVLGTKAKILPLGISMLLHGIMLFALVIASHERERIFTVELMMQESMSGNAKTSERSIRNKKTGFSKNSVKKESQAESAFNAPEAKNTDIQKSEPSPLAENPSFSKPENVQSSHWRADRNEGATLTSGASGVSTSGFHDKESSSSYVAKGNNSGRDIVEGEFGSINGPSFLKMVKPEYPRFARRLGKEGKVVLRLFIDGHGRLVSVEIVEKAGHGFDEASVNAVKASTFRPAKLNGHPVACKALLPVRFKLE
ncbi:MAG TPA: hypothetical protein DD713_08545 [Nitrospiraceae bacterium]|nr:hypothetical protein [Nitrospiraceae bacterium]